MWQQRRFWPQRKPFKLKPRKKQFNPARQLYEYVELEEDVVRKILSLSSLGGVPMFRQPERRPCGCCGKWHEKPSDAGHPDLHGYIKRGKCKFPDGTTNTHPIPVYCEVKRPGRGDKDLRFMQKRFLMYVKDDGVLAFVADSWEAYCAALKTVGVTLPVG